MKNFSLITTLILASLNMAYAARNNKLPFEFNKEGGQALFVCSGQGNLLHMRNYPWEEYEKIVIHANKNNKIGIYTYNSSNHSAQWWQWPKYSFIDLSHLKQEKDGTISVRRTIKDRATGPLGWKTLSFHVNTNGDGEAFSMERGPDPSDPTGLIPLLGHKKKLILNNCVKKF